jgi:acyl-CoA thioester hydrolase
MMGSEDWPDVAGRLTDGGHVLPIRVYFEDTDFSGFVYHASYLRFMERGRSDFLRLHGIGHDALDRDVDRERRAFAVRHMVVDFLKGARIDDLLEVRTRVERITGARIVLAQRILRGDEVLTSAEVTVVLANRAGVPRRLSSELVRRLGGTGAA